MNLEFDKLKRDVATIKYDLEERKLVSYFIDYIEIIIKLSFILLADTGRPRTSSRKSTRT